MKNRNLSSAISLIDLVWEKSFKCKSHSWDQFNSSLRSALNLAITSGMIFDLNDFEYISGNYRFGYWAGNDGHMMGEGCYGLSIESNNMKAAQSFESWKKRKPFIFRNVKAKFYMDMRKKCRLFVGCEFKWKGEKVKVTSFSEDGTYLVACSYKEKPKDGYSREKIKHQYKISNSELRKELKWLNKCDAFEKGLKLGSMFHEWIVDLFVISIPDELQSRHMFFKMLIR